MAFLRRDFLDKIRVYGAPMGRVRGKQKDSR
jgi:hypothetical protein